MLSVKYGVTKYKKEKKIFGQILNSYIYFCKLFMQIFELKYLTATKSRRKSIKIG